MTTESLFIEKIKQLTEELQKKCGPDNLNRDDKTLSEMTVGFSVKVEKLVGEEIKAIQEGKENSNEKKLRLVKIREELRKISWLPRSFQTSLNIQLVFVSAKIN